MFGWEFPPHISGGLGTACYGLTSALIKEDVELFFVVPKLFGSEPDNGSVLVDASEIKTSDRATGFTNAVNMQETTASLVTQMKTTSQPGMTTIEVPSLLSPYTPAHVEQSHYDMQYWNFEENFTTTTLNSSATHEMRKSSPVKPYVFSGGYGERLIEEVYQYERVAIEIVKRYDFDIIHAHDWMTFPAALAAKKATGKPLIVHVHATEYDRAGKNGNPVVHRIEKEGMLGADRVVAVSRWTKNLLAKDYGIRPSKITVVHNGVIPNDQAQHKNTHPLGRDLVTFLGRITYQKGPEYFVDAARKVADRLPHVHFVMAGSGDFLPQIILKVANLKLSSRFHFTGFLRKPDIDKILSYTRVYVMPSVSEPFGITPLEAIQAGVPVIISKQSGVGEVMNHALKVDFWDTDAMSQAICSVLQHNSLSETLRKNSAEEINSITWEKAARNVKTLYHELTGIK
jgi:glycogen(starch) synthase